MQRRMGPTTRIALGTAALVAATAAALAALGRPALCSCGELELWGAVGPKQSQMLADWYSPSHVIHGLLFYFAGWAMLRRWSLGARFLAALALEAAWEIVENTPLVIDRYREATMALGYSGDSIVNSLSDLTMMAAGFVIARRLPVWASVALGIAAELAALLAVRDNLTLNVWMLIAPSSEILEWQAGA